MQIRQKLLEATKDMEKTEDEYISGNSQLEELEQDLDVHLRNFLLSTKLFTVFESESEKVPVTKYDSGKDDFWLYSCDSSGAFILKDDLISAVKTNYLYNPWVTLLLLLF